MLINENNLQQLIETIRQVHHTTIDQRLIDLTEFLTEFFQSFQADQCHLFRLLTQLLRDYDDRAALKIEFVRGQCFEAIYQLLSVNEDHLIVLFEFLLELLKNSENVQEKFLLFRGYEKFFGSLRHIHSPARDLIDQFLQLTLDSSIEFDPLNSLAVNPSIRLNNANLLNGLIYWIPHLNDRLEQIYLVSTIDQIVLRSMQNKMIASSHGIPLALIDILNEEKTNGIIIDEEISRKIFVLLENLFRFSIDSEAIRRICQLLKKNSPWKKHLLRLFLLAVKYRDLDSGVISSFFDLQRSNSGIFLPVIDRWPSISSSHFTFHSWLRLNHEVHTYPHEGHRQIYSLYTNAIGLEAFLSNATLIVLINDQDEFVYTELKDCEDLIDGSWHSLTIVHTTQRPSRFISAFQHSSTCQLSIYIDGQLRKEVPDLKYLSLINESIVYASIGAANQRPRTSINRMKSDSLTTTLTKTISPLTGFLSSKMKSATNPKTHLKFYSSTILTSDAQNREGLFGSSNSLFGQIACIWMLVDTLDSSQVKHLHSMGPDFCHYPRSSVSTFDPSSIIFDLLTNRSLLVYHPLACNDQLCLDISGGSATRNGRLVNCSSSRLYSFSQALLRLGGCTVLYPLFDLFHPNHQQNIVEPSLFPMHCPQINEKETKSLMKLNEQLNSNPIVSILHLIHDILSSSSIHCLRKEMIKSVDVELLAEYLNRLSSSFIDVEFLKAIEQLIDVSREFDPSNHLTNELLKHILLNFSLWNKAQFQIRSAHLQYINKYVKNEKHFNREMFGVEFFLDVLKEYFNTSDEEIDEEKQLRMAIYNLVQHLIRQNPSIKDFEAILSTIATSTNVIVQELLYLIFSFLDPPTTNSATVVHLLAQSNLFEQLYSLLIVHSLSNETKILVLKMINIAIQSGHLSEHEQAQLRLEANHIGFGGIISGLAINEFNSVIVHEILQLIVSSSSPIAVHHLNTVLTLCSAASLEVRCMAIRNLMQYFIAHPSACRLYAKSSGWHETLAHFFVRIRRSSSASLINSAPPMPIHDQNLISQYSSSADSTGQDREISTRSKRTNSDRSSPEKQLDNDESSSMQEEIDDEMPRPARLTRGKRVISSMNLINPTDDSYANEMIMTPPESTTDSSEDLLSIMEQESSTPDSSPVIITSDTSTSEPASWPLRSSMSTDDHSVLEEMCETLILAIVMILWKGIVESDEAAWMIRGQIFSALRHVHREYEFYKSLDEIERRLLELSMEACLNDLKLDHGQQTATYENNCRELIKLVHDYLYQSPDNHHRITTNLVNGILPILDTMLIFKKLGNENQPIVVHPAHEDQWSETSLTSLNILLILLAHPNVAFCSQASIRIHSFLDYRPIHGREEAAFLLSTVNKIFSSISQTEQSERYAYILPLLTIIIDESFDLLQIRSYLPEISFHRKATTAVNDLRQAIFNSKNLDWERFIEQITEPYADHYRSMSIRPFHMNMRIWWNECHERMLIGVHKRNRQIGTEKMKFQNQIVRPWYPRARLDQQRIYIIIEERRIQRIHLAERWRHRMRYLEGERGPWFNDLTTKVQRWIISDRENHHRMRCKLVENDHFNQHERSSRLRDNLRIDSLDQPYPHYFSSKAQIDVLTRRRESLHRNSIDEQEMSKIKTKSRRFVLDEKETIKLRQKCSLITLMSKTEGEFIVTEKFMYFLDASSTGDLINDLKYPLHCLEEIYPRRYNLRPSALEFFLINRRNFLLNFNEQERPEIYQKFLSLKVASMKSITLNFSTPMSPAEILRESRLTEKWLACEISNFDYLMMLNTIAGRTYNDLNQYPIFPWVLKDYTSNILDLNNPSIYRDFSKPIGIQNSKHINEVKSKYESFEDPSGLVKKFHYGTHYSNAASVMHYLLRMEPFATLHIHLQSGRFDIADRQFHCFQSSWMNIMESPNDGKELIPEFFYLPEFLVNLNQFDLGKLQSNNQVLNDVELPPWAHQSPEEFIRIHRLALESDFVSAHLHQWIDLIFGYKQSGQAAIDALNVYMYASYEKISDDEIIDDPVTREAIDAMIENFGQNPMQLFTEPHPQRQSYQQAALQMESQGRPLNIFQNIDRVRAFFVDIMPMQQRTSAPIVFLSIPKNQLRSFTNQTITDTLITINERGVIGNNGWLPFDRSSKNRFTFERDPALFPEKNRLNVTVPFSPSIAVTSRLFAVSHDGKYIFSGGHWDWSLQVYSVVKCKILQSLIHHTDVITCLALDSTGYVLVTGSRDRSCIIWSLSLNEQDSSSIVSSQRSLFGHTDEVTCVAVSSELDLVASGSLDGTCNIHTVEDGIYVRTLKPTGQLYDPIRNLKLSDERHLLIQTENEETHLFLYSINGDLIRTRKFEYRIVDFLISDQHIVLAVNHSTKEEQIDKSSTKDAALTESARIIIKDLFQMTTIRALRFRANVLSLFITKELGHLLVTAKDGKLFVVTVRKDE